MNRVVHSPRKKKGTIIKYTVAQLSKPLFILVMAIMVVTSGLLITEFRFFKEQSQRFLELKQDYDNYVMAFKKVLTEYDELKEQFNDIRDQLPEEKKKLLDNLASLLN